jgi:hypothetical protein
MKGTPSRRALQAPVLPGRRSSRGFAKRKTSRENSSPTRNAHLCIASEQKKTRLCLVCFCSEWDPLTQGFALAPAAAIFFGSNRKKFSSPHGSHAGGFLPSHFLRSKKLLGVGLEPTRFIQPRDFKSPVSTIPPSKLTEIVCEKTISETLYFSVVFRVTRNRMIKWSVFTRLLLACIRIGENLPFF